MSPKINIKYPGAGLAPVNSAEIRTDGTAGRVTVNGRPMTWPDGTPVYAGQIEAGAWLDVDVGTGVVTKHKEPNAMRSVRWRVFNFLGWCLCELAFKTHCWGPFGYVYDAGCWCYEKAEG